MYKQNYADAEIDHPTPHLAPGGHSVTASRPCFLSFRRPARDSR